MKVLFGVDGFDGAGKTSLITDLLVEFGANGVDATAIGRGQNDSDEFTAQMTEIIKRSDGVFDGGIASSTSLHLRLARLAQRARVAGEVKAKVTVWDRFLLTDAAMLPSAERRQFLGQAESLVGDFQILHFSLNAPFAVLSERIQARGDFSPKELLGTQHLSRLHDRYQKVAEVSRFPWELHQIDASRPSDEVRQSVLALSKQKIGWIA